MQAVTDAQRALLTANRLEVDFGAEVLNLDLTLATDYGPDGDISEHVRGGSVSWNGYATIHRTCRLDLSVELPWGTVLVRPYMTVGGHRWNVGVFLLATPERVVGESPATFSCQGYDRLTLLQREIGEDYTATASTTYRDALVDLLTAAGLSGYQIEGEAADFTLPVDRMWPLVGTSSNPDDNVGNTPTTFLRALNDLLAAINFRSVWCDESGVFRFQRYQEPVSRPVEWTFDADDELTTVVGETRTVVRDIWKAPNRWVVIASNPPSGVTPSTGNGYIQVRENVADDDLSQVARGLVWPKVYTFEVASVDALSAIADRKMADDRRVSSSVTLATSPLPVASHFDVVQVVDGDGGVSGKAQAVSWKMPLDGGDMSWTLEMVGA